MKGTADLQVVGALFVLGTLSSAFGVLAIGPTLIALGVKAGVIVATIVLTLLAFMSVVALATHGWERLARHVGGTGTGVGHDMLLAVEIMRNSKEETFGCGVLAAILAAMGMGVSGEDATGRPSSAEAAKALEAAVCEAGKKRFLYNYRDEIWVVVDIKRNDRSGCDAAVDVNGPQDTDEDHVLDAMVAATEVVRMESNAKAVTLFRSHVESEGKGDVEDALVTEAEQ